MKRGERREQTKMEETAFRLSCCCFSRRLTTELQNAYTGRPVRAMDNFETSEHHIKKGAFCESVLESRNNK